MDEVTQQNAALVEEAAAAAESLEDQTRVLTQAVSMFDLGNAAVGSAAAQASTPRVSGSAGGAKPGPRSEAKSTPLRSSPDKRRPTRAAGKGDEDHWEEF
ncbi:Methyl-accepting chemotaxis protein I (serine chemoreceptor protein) [Imhoffiella purpurea]|uniref:Methyl-accepting chemotaxis protein I (Serine chemoreceptor protein) n=1 Tax=Imhoffiella purpurea TaxID=1249627 RepID=W9V470_9GAMM|nr:Methyl-accepting chemotaxis protein I (serine chemoreceptor protein) [Imhoffiella purpurea]